MSQFILSPTTDFPLPDIFLGKTQHLSRSRHTIASAQFDGNATIYGNYQVFMDITSEIINH